jgi:hypothetical protein
MRQKIKKFIKRLIFPPPRRLSSNPSIPFSGYEKHLTNIPFVEHLSDGQLQELNSVLDWKAFVVDLKGRRFGNSAWTNKRSEPQEIPDYRHDLLARRIKLSDKSILEVGCFEGIHTVSLCRLAKQVIAIDSRIENVVKTIVRANFFNERPLVLTCDVETWNIDKALLRADVCHHIGVLYHLKDPVVHLQTLASMINEAILLDTHVATTADKLSIYSVKDVKYRYKTYLEGGSKDVFSGMYDHAKWLLLEDLKDLFKSIGFINIEILEERSERNGPRVLLLARR